MCKFLFCLGFGFGLRWGLAMLLSLAFTVQAEVILQPQPPKWLDLQPQTGCCAGFKTDKFFVVLFLVGLGFGDEVLTTICSGWL
jgi:hypothetical protein